MNKWITFGAISMAIGVALGAFGTHALKDSFSSDQLNWWATAQQYQIWHALGLILVGLLATISNKGLNASGWLLTFGTFIFSGTLYLMALTQTRWLGAITPIGGACLIAAWIALPLALKKLSPSS